MKKLFTLAAAASLAAASLSAQAQVTVDGVLNTAEIGGTSGYVLIGKYTNARGFGDAGLLSLYVATTATKVTFFLGGTVEANGNSFQMYLKTPASAGVPAGTALPSGTTGTSFEKMNAKLDLATNLAIALRSATGGYKLEGISYTSATAATTEAALVGANPVLGTGVASTVSATTIPALVGARVAYRATADGKLVGANTATPSNPGAITPNTAAGYGAAGSYGMEFELDRAAAGLTGTAALRVFAVQNNNDGGFLSTDFIPQSTAAAAATTATNLGLNPDFSTISGTQAASLNLTATGVTLATKAADAALIGLNVYPNPTMGTAVVSYRVAQAATVSIALTDLLGRPVRTVESGAKTVGNQTSTLNTSDLAAGTYLVRVQVGENVSTSKISVL